MKPHRLLQQQQQLQLQQQQLHHQQQQQHQQHQQLQQHQKHYNLITLRVFSNLQMKINCKKNSHKQVSDTKTYCKIEENQTLCEFNLL